MLSDEMFLFLGTLLLSLRLNRILTLRLEAPWVSIPVAVFE